MNEKFEVKNIKFEKFCTTFYIKSDGMLKFDNTIILVSANLKHY